MHPYAQLPNERFWRRHVANVPWRDLAFCGEPKFTLAADTRIATAGSCFAQHIARHLSRVGLATYVTEQAHPLQETFGDHVESYRLFSARYGNVYTARQCLELVQQACGERPVVEDFVESNGRWFDLLRPNILPDGFASRIEAQNDRRYHLTCVKRLFATADVFIFTLGLTESWCHAQDGYTYPVCPGTAKGTYDPAMHKFYNFSVSDVIADLERLLALLRELNPTLRVILTVSPVPLVATWTKQNVLLASSYSKAALRAACGEVEQRHDHVQYFPSYEIISHAASFGQYLDADLREVTPRGVAHVMAHFLETFCGSLTGASQTTGSAATAAPATPPALAGLLQAECDELFNDIVL